ncbi:hypothetical protein FCH28_20250 [Streptomyces piniterrae]|uniref:Uncharacterized protein n=1 Tax=Streptomyces piniterrae TaxID=2571125 RepID=A0A4V5MM74_9ACTN|nr:hypothetical protein [Streptomyces piniterrae]TJZ52158.1 hypothetical protein FCH28_20250 [Streptomyces piniterrae]
MIPAAIVLSHDEQRERLRRGCPEAVPRSHVIGDPCADQIRISAPFREEYRTALGIRPGQKLVLLTSTWGERSFLGRSPAPGAPSDPGIIRRALAELPVDEYRALAAIHPNAWHWHGGWQIRSWLEPYIRAGLLVPTPESDSWKAAICAADAFIGDHGSLTLYAAAHGLPGLLASFDDDCVAAGSPMARLGELLPRVSPSLPLRQQLAHAARRQPGDARIARAAAQVTSRPGEALSRLRELCYAHLGLAEPVDPVVPRPVALPVERTAPRRTPLAQPLFVATRFTDAEAGEEGPGRPQVTVRRYPAALQGERGTHLTDPHVVVEEGEPEERWAGVADIVVIRRSTPRGPTPAPERLFTRHPGCIVVAVPAPAGSAGDCTLHLRDGREFTARWGGSAWWTEPAVAASALHAWLTRDEEDDAAEVTIDVAIGPEPAGSDADAGESPAPLPLSLSLSLPLVPPLPGSRPGQPAQRLLRLETPQPPVDGQS